MRPIIIHISNDFPDPIVPNKTRAVQNLIDGTPEFRHIVYSLNRVDGWSGIAPLSFGADRTAIAYKALPKGLLWESRLRDVGAWIIADLARQNIVPDLLQGHKFTVEGLIARQLAAVYKKPFVCSIQGDTDTRILQTKVSLRPTYQDIADKAALLFPFAIWPVATFQNYITLAEDKIRVLPVVPGIDTLSSAPAIHEPRLLTVFHLDSWKRKNVLGVIHAIKSLQSSFPDITLDIYGRGTPSTLMALTKLIAESGMEKSVKPLGPAPNGELPTLMKNYAAFVLPSKRESYGLVHAEALFSGLPVLYSKGRGIDGFFDEKTIGYGCNPLDTEDIARGIAHLITNQSTLKDSIAQLQNSGGMDIIRKQHILNVYRQGLLEALAA